MKAIYAPHPDGSDRKRYYTTIRQLPRLLGCLLALGASFTLLADPGLSQKNADETAETTSASIEGMIDGFRHYSPPGAGENQQETLIRLRLEDGRSVVVALGSNERLDNLGLQKNQRVEIRGHAAIVEGVPALVAEEIRLNGKRVDLQSVVNPAPESQEGQKSRTENPNASQNRSDRVELSQPAQQELNAMREAYRQLKRVQFTGVYATDFQIDGSVVKTGVDFTSSFQAPNKFRHETVDILFGSTGAEAYLLNRKTNSYQKAEINPKEPLVHSLPPSVVSLLHTEDPSLLAALAQSPIDKLLKVTDDAEKLEDVDLDGKSYAQLKLSLESGHSVITVLVDPETHLIRRATADLKEWLEQSGAKEVKRAVAIINYSKINTEPKFADDQFAWTPPQNSSDVASQRNQEEASGKELAGQQAPEFQLTTLDGKTISLSELRGKVVVLDFWASWCPPCQESLPHLGKLYRDHKPDENVQVYAVNVNEDRENVQSFITSRAIQVPVLIDADGSVAKQYQVGGIPKTVIIGKDGRIAKVFSGFGDDTYDQIRQEITAAAKGQPETTQTENKPGGKTRTAAVPAEAGRSVPK